MNSHNPRIVFQTGLFLACSLFSQLALAQNATPSAAVAALRRGLTEQATITADVDGDGDQDRLIQVDEGTDVKHCVAVFQSPSGWTAAPVFSLGGDRSDRCLGLVSGRVIVAQLSPGAAEVVTVTLFAMRVTAAAVTIGRGTRASSAAASTFDQLTARAQGTTAVVVSTPRGVSVATLRL